ncbi:MAG: hypothetical protein LBV00_12170 [Propionibacteriaceae bacterium]|nr:hypothetical protein [Propionibacteriaceae bacterium]
MMITEIVIAAFSPLIAIWLGLVGLIGVVVTLLVHTVSGRVIQAWLIYLLGGMPIGCVGYFGYIWIFRWAWCLTELCG